MSALPRDRGDARHRGKPADAAAAGEPDQHRFGLIVERMSGEHMAGGAARAAPASNR